MNTKRHSDGPLTSETLLKLAGVQHDEPLNDELLRALTELQHLKLQLVLAERARDRSNGLLTMFGLLGLGASAVLIVTAFGRKGKGTKAASNISLPVPDSDGTVDVKTSFDPATSGLHFRNNFPDSEYLGLSFPGLCGGMVWTALDYFNANVPTPLGDTTPSTTSTALGAYIHSRQADTLLGANGPRFLSLLANPSDESLASTSNDEFATLQDSLNQNVPVALGLIPSPWTPNVTKAHQVLAYGYVVDVDSNRTINIWDPNKPNSTTTTLVQAAGQQLWTEAAAHDTWRGFFVETGYVPKSPPAPAAVQVPPTSPTPVATPASPTTTATGHYPDRTASRVAPHRFSLFSFLLVVGHLVPESIKLVDVLNLDRRRQLSCPRAF